VLLTLALSLTIFLPIQQDPEMRQDWVTVFNELGFFSVIMPSFGLALIFQKRPVRDLNLF
jgi:hypothetical protein